MENIIVIDNFLEKDELNKCVQIIKDNKWEWGHSSNGFFSESLFWKMDLMENYYFFKKITSIIEETFSKKFIVKRLYANAHTYGQDGSYHIDDNNENCYTFCLYLTNINNEYIETAGGHLFFKFPNLKYNICYEPIFNRGILFPSSYIHKATSFSRYIMDLRICVAWKLEEIK